MGARFYKRTIYIFFFLKVESHVTQTGLKLSTGVQPSPKMLGTEPSTSRILSEHYTNSAHPSPRKPFPFTNKTKKTAIEKMNKTAH